MVHADDEDDKVDGEDEEVPAVVLFIIASDCFSLLVTASHCFSLLPTASHCFSLLLRRNLLTPSWCTPTMTTTKRTARTRFLFLCCLSLLPTASHCFSLLLMLLTASDASHCFSLLLNVPQVETDTGDDDVAGEGEEEEEESEVEQDGDERKDDTVTQKKWKCDVDGVTTSMTTAQIANHLPALVNSLPQRTVRISKLLETRYNLAIRVVGGGPTFNARKSFLIEVRAITAGGGLIDVHCDQSDCCGTGGGIGGTALLRPIHPRGLFCGR
jgi:hypothetical protein